MIQSWENLVADGRMDRRTDGRMDRRTNRWMDRQTDEGDFIRRCPTNVECPMRSYSLLEKTLNFKLEFLHIETMYRNFLFIKILNLLESKIKDRFTSQSTWPSSFNTFELLLKELRNCNQKSFWTAIFNDKFILWHIKLTI